VKNRILNLIGAAVVATTLCAVVGSFVAAPSVHAQQQTPTIYPGDWTNYTIVVTPAATASNPMTIVSSVGNVVSLTISNQNTNGFYIAVGPQASALSAQTNNLATNTIYIAGSSTLTWGVGTAQPYILPGPYVAKSEGTLICTANVTKIMRQRQ
jgi:hypothetical protein